MYQIIVISMFKNWSRTYSNYHIIKFEGFISIYYVINLIIVSSCMIFIYLYLGSMDLLQVSINNIIFFSFQKKPHKDLIIFF